MTTTSVSAVDPAEFAAAQAALRGETAVVARLTDRAVIRATGPDAGDFLNNLLTNEIKGLPAGEVRLAGLCSPKGRLLGLFSVLRDPRDTDDFLLLLPAELAPSLLKKLSMYVLRSKIKLSDVSGDYAVFGALGCAQTPVDGINLRWNRTTPEIQLILAPVSATPPPATMLGLDHWRWLEIAAGWPSVVAATQEAFVPQMLNLELAAVGGVSFRKGCYPGQEIVARTQYLGKIKRRMLRAHIAAGPEPIYAPGTPLFAAASGEQACGQLVSVAPEADGWAVLACLQVAMVEAGPVCVGDLTGPSLEFLPLPYDLDGPDTRSA